MGSLVAAVGSYLDAKSRNGIWLVRMEDLDSPRCVPGAANNILHTLARFGLISDEAVMYQSMRTPAYQHAFDQLMRDGHLYPCACTRREIADSALHRGRELIYPGKCRAGLPESREARSWRVLVEQNRIEFTDRVQGPFAQNLAYDAGDFLLRRRDGLFAYQLAVVVDDAEQNITDIVRGADLLDSTLRQIYLQQLLNFHTPTYLHLPVAVNQQGEKLSKQTQAKAVEPDNTAATLYKVLDFLGQRPPASLRKETALLAWAVDNWRPEVLSGHRQRTV